MVQTSGGAGAHRDWSTPQRWRWGLPGRDALERAHRDAWGPCRCGEVDVLWRTADRNGIPCCPVPGVGALVVGRQWPIRDWTTASGAFSVRRRCALHPGPDLPMDTTPSTAYDDLRHCPYRFFRCGSSPCREADELDTEIGKRDFGSWFAWCAAPLPRRPAETLEAQRPPWTRTQRPWTPRRRKHYFGRGISAVRGGFWPRADRYVALADAATWARAPDFRQSAESDPVSGWAVSLLRAHRSHRSACQMGQPLVIDYKTEGLGVTQERVKSATEDTQLAFYAALLQDDVVRPPM